jgi:hypothetical protein
MRVGETIAVEDLFGRFISPEVSVLWKLVLIKSNEIGNTQIIKPSCIVTRFVDDLFRRKGPGASTKGTIRQRHHHSGSKKRRGQLQIRQAEGLTSVGVSYFWPIEAKQGPNSDSCSQGQGYGEVPAVSKQKWTISAGQSWGWPATAATLTNKGAGPLQSDSRFQIRHIVICALAVVP